MRSIKRSEEVPFTPEQMFQLVNDIEKYPEFIPWCGGTKILLRNEDEVKATIEIAAAGFGKSFTTHNLMQKNKMIEIRLIDGPFQHLEGFWLFESMANNNCRIKFDLKFELAGSFFDFAFDPIFYQLAGSMVDAFCERAKRVY